MLSSMPKYMSENMSIRFWLDKVSYFRNTKLNYTWFSAHQTLRLSSKLLCIHNMSHLWQTMLAGVRVWNARTSTCLCCSAQFSSHQTPWYIRDWLHGCAHGVGPCPGYCDGIEMQFARECYANFVVPWAPCKKNVHHDLMARFSKCKFPNFWNCRPGDKAKGTRYAALLRWFFFLGFHANTHSTNQLPMKCHGSTSGIWFSRSSMHLNDFAHQRNTSCVETSGGLPHGAHKNDLSIHRSF